VPVVFRVFKRHPFSKKGRCFFNKKDDPFSTRSDTLSSIKKDTFFQKKERKVACPLHFHGGNWPSFPYYPHGNLPVQRSNLQGYQKLAQETGQGKVTHPKFNPPGLLHYLIYLLSSNLD
jgi:hypothetical protein